MQPPSEGRGPIPQKGGSPTISGGLWPPGRLPRNAPPARSRSRIPLLRRGAFRGTKRGELRSASVPLEMEDLHRLGLPGLPLIRIVAHPPTIVTPIKDFNHCGWLLIRVIAITITDHRQVRIYCL